MTLLHPVRQAIRLAMAATLECEKCKHWYHEGCPYPYPKVSPGPGCRTFEAKAKLHL